MLFDTQSANKRTGSDSVIAEEQIFSTVMDSQLDGVIILGSNINYLTIPEGYLEGLQKLITVLTVIVVGRQLARYDYTCLHRDQVSCVKMVTEYLLGKGHRDIAFIGGSPEVYMTGKRVSAFRETLRQAGLSPDDALVNETNFYARHGYEAIEKLLSGGRALPQALIAINDRVAMGAIRALKDNGLDHALNGVFQTKALKCTSSQVWCCLPWLILSLARASGVWGLSCCVRFWRAKKFWGSRQINPVLWQ